MIQMSTQSYSNIAEENEAKEYLNESQCIDDCLVITNLSVSHFCVILEVEIPRGCLKNSN